MRARGFTFIELVVAITISGIVLVFVAMFIGAPLGAYQTHSRRAALVADTSGAWPRMESDLRTSLPNSLRTRRNGNYVVLEMLPVMGVARYKTPPSALTFTTAGVYGGAAPAYLFVNSGAPGTDVYALNGSMAPASNYVPAAGAVADEQQIGVNPAPVFITDSPGRKIYFVARPITYLCDAGQGTLQRYANYTLAPIQTSRDTPGELTAAGAAVELVTQGLTTCNFDLSLIGTQPQNVSVRLTTTRNGDTVALLHSAHSEYVP
jgi:prepilin-type N-terminal cleavage/methylation domain-containing protein